MNGPACLRPRPSGPGRPPRVERRLYVSIVAAGVLVVVSAVLMSAVRPAPAQDLRVGVRAGPTFGFLSDSPIPFRGSALDAATNVNLRLDVHGGGYVVVPLTGRWSVQPEVLVLQRGGHLSRPTSESYAAERYRLSYAQGAVLARRAIALPGPLSMHAVGGVAVDRALGGTLRRDRRTTGIDAHSRVDLLASDRLRRWDAGGIVGVELGYPTGPSGRAALELRYSYGFRAVFKRSPPAADPFPLTGASSFHHDAITASLSYTLPPASLF